MPKLKTKNSAKKRFVTASGKLKTSSGRAWYD